MREIHIRLIFNERILINKRTKMRLILLSFLQSHGVQCEVSSSSNIISTINNGEERAVCRDAHIGTLNG